MNDSKINRRVMYTKILDIFSDGVEMTAGECAQLLKKDGTVHFGIRQEVQPRIVEMIKLGLMRPYGKKFDVKTRKTVTTYKKLSIKDITNKQNAD